MRRSVLEERTVTAARVPARVRLGMRKTMTGVVASVAAAAVPLAAAGWPRLASAAESPAAPPQPLAPAPATSMGAPPPGDGALVLDDVALQGETRAERLDP